MRIHAQNSVLCVLQGIDFYEQFHVLVLGLDSVEARRYMNSVACSFLGAHRRLPSCVTFKHAFCSWLAGSQPTGRAQQTSIRMPFL